MAAASPLKERIRQKADELGFNGARFTAPDAIPEAPARLAAFLSEGRHGDMLWMEGRADERSDPARLWSGVRTVIMLGLNYGPGYDPLPLLKKTSRGVISVYAHGADYHKIVKSKLKALGRWLAQEAGCALKVFVDTAPVMEKPLAEAAGLGWQGKHTNLVSKDWGSWLFLGAIYLDVEIAPDAPEADHCGRCQKCLDICPTGAFPAPYQLDARRCVSYLTIEHKGHIAEEFRTAIGNRIYGCDDCLAVCPWNKFASVAAESRFHARSALEAPSLASLAGLCDAEFRSLFAGSPIKRIGRDRFIRNVMIAIGNSGDAELAGAAEARLADASPLVRAMAVWALRRLVPQDRWAALKAAHASEEGDGDVAAEWSAPAERHIVAASARNDQPTSE